jgi:hypothetical protein
MTKLEKFNDLFFIFSSLFMNLSVPPTEDSLVNTPGNHGQVWHNASPNILILNDPTENCDHRKIAAFLIYQQLS